jgi:hypothetical protein
LRDVFTKTRCPNWNAIEEQASVLLLNESIIKSEFKKLQVKWEKQNQAHQSTNQVISVKKEEIPLIVAENPPMTANTEFQKSEYHDHELL